MAEGNWKKEIGEAIADTAKTKKTEKGSAGSKLWICWQQKG